MRMSQRAGSEPSRLDPPQCISISICEYVVQSSGDRSCLIHAVAVLPNPRRARLRRRLHRRRSLNSRPRSPIRANAATTSRKRAKSTAAAVRFVSPVCCERPPHRRPFAWPSTTLLDGGDNALQLAGDGFGDRLERRIANMLHGYCRVDGCLLYTSPSPRD